MSLLGGYDIIFRDKQEQHKNRICHRFQHLCLNWWQILFLYWALKRPHKCEALMGCSSIKMQIKLTYILSAIDLFLAIQRYLLLLSYSV